MRDKIEITKNDIYQFLKEKDSSRYSVIEIYDGISEGTRGDTYSQEEYISVTCKVSYVNSSKFKINIEDRKVCINKDVLLNYIKENNSITWYDN